MDAENSERRSGGARRWLKEQRLWPDRRVADNPIDSADRRTESRRTHEDRRQGSRRSS